MLMGNGIHYLFRTKRMKCTQILYWGVILGLCLSLPSLALEPTLKKVSPPDEAATESQIDPLGYWMWPMCRTPAVTPSRHYLCLQSAGGIVIDGHLNDADWKKAIWSETFIDIRALGSSQPLPMTKFKMLWGDGYLYIGHHQRLQHPRQNIWQDNRRPWILTWRYASTQCR
jgi:hypothetical protein